MLPLTVASPHFMLKRYVNIALYDGTQIEQPDITFCKELIPVWVSGTYVQSDCTCDEINDLFTC